MDAITNVAQPPLAAPRRRLLSRALAVAGSILLIIIALFGFMIYRMNYVPADLDLATTQRSHQGVYQVSYTPTRPPIAINQIHTWTIHIATPDGQPVTDAVITVDGDMPQHGHGLPTQPQVTRHLGNGDYLVEGMKFQMGGWWVVDFTIESGAQRDTVRFNMML